MTRFSLDTRTVTPQEIQQPGVFLPIDPSMSPEQVALVGGLLQKVGELTGTTAFDINLPSDDTVVLPYTPEENGSLGRAGFQEVMDFLAPPGLETGSHFLQTWHQLRVASSGFLRETERWLAYEPLQSAQVALIAERRQHAEAEDQFSEAAAAKYHDLEARQKQLDKQTRRVLGQSRNFSYEAPIQRPFIVVIAEMQETFLTTDQNSPSKGMPVPDEQTALDLDNLHHNFGYSFGSSVNARTIRMLKEFTNRRILAREIG